MQPLSIHYVRARYRGSRGGQSPWSVPTQFTTGTSTLSGVELQKLIPSDGKSKDAFGTSVALSHLGDYLAVGTRLGDGKSKDTGSVYVYLRTGNTWALQAELSASDGQTNDSFGAAIAFNLNATYLAIGAYQDDDLGVDAGSVYVFTRAGTTWTQQAKLKAADGTAQDYFGNALALSNDASVLAIGAYGDNLRGADEGAVYLYTRVNASWTFQEKVSASDAFTQDYFGGDIALSGDGKTLVVGSTGSQSGGRFRGAAYVFTESMGLWTQTQKLVSPTATDYDSMGQHVAITRDGSRLAVSGYDTTGSGYTKGQVNVYRYVDDRYVFETRLLAADAAAKDYFGSSLGLSYDGKTIVVGAYYDDDKGTNSGSVYLFTRLNTTWSQVAKLKASDGQANDWFGYSAALASSGSVLAVGAYGEDAKASECGAVYVYR